MSASKTERPEKSRHGLDEIFLRREMLAGLAQALGSLQIDRDELADALLGHGDPEEPVHTGHGDGIVGYDHEACVR